jgi:RNA polymerase primary sigma factor
MSSMGRKNFGDVPTMFSLGQKNQANKPKSLLDSSDDNNNSVLSDTAITDTSSEPEAPKNTAPMFGQPPAQPQQPPLMAPAQPQDGTSKPASPYGSKANEPFNMKPSSQLKIEPEYEESFNNWKKNQTPESNDMMLQKIQPIIEAALKSYVGQDVPPSVRLHANRMALEALNTYDPAQAKLKTHLMSHLQGLRRVYAKSNQILNVPERVQIDSYHLNQAMNELTDKLGREPTDQELSDHTGMSLKRIETIRSFKPGISEGAATEAMFSGDDEYVNDPAVNIPGTSDSGDAWRRFVYDGLDPRSQMVMEHTFGMNGKEVLDNEALARKLGISPARVSQIRAEIQKKLDSREKVGVL